MKIKYEFADETVEIEVSDEWGEILIDLDRQEYNNNHKEKRRHASLDAYDLDGTLFAADVDVETDALNEIEKELLYAAIEKLKPQQRALLRRVYFGGEKLLHIAREEGVSKVALTNRMTKIYDALKKYLK